MCIFVFQTGLYFNEQYSTTPGTADENVRIYGRKTVGRRRYGHSEWLTNATFKSAGRTVRKVWKEVKRIQSCKVLKKWPRLPNCWFYLCLHCIVIVSDENFPCSKIESINFVAVRFFLQFGTPNKEKCQRTWWVIAEYQRRKPKSSTGIHDGSGRNIATVDGPNGRLIVVICADLRKTRIKTNSSWIMEARYKDTRKISGPAANDGQKRKTFSRVKWSKQTKTL